MFKAMRVARAFGEGGERKRRPIIYKPEMLLRLAKSRYADIRFSVARSPYTPVQALEILAADESWVVRMAVAEHPGATRAMIKALLADPEISVRKAAQRRPLLVETANEIAEEVCAA